jgi:hypothetical protein
MKEQLMASILVYKIFLGHSWSPGELSEEKNCRHTPNTFMAIKKLVGSLDTNVGSFDFVQFFSLKFGIDDQQNMDTSDLIATNTLESWKKLEMKILFSHSGSSRLPNRIVFF